MRTLIKKAVIPAAGMGTRMLPLTKTQPKEMLPLGDKPCIQYIVEELAGAGVQQILIITGQKKRAIEDHFDKDVELSRMLSLSGQKEIITKLAYEDMDVQFFYTRQSTPAGLGDAIRQARNFVGAEPFIIALGDSVICSDENSGLLKRMLKLHQAEPDAFILATREVPRDQVELYGIVKPCAMTDSNVVEVADVVEKPAPSKAPSTLAFAARYIMPAKLFDALERTTPGKGGELQLTDAIRLMLKEGMKGYSVSLTDREKRYDIGDLPSYYEAFLDYALADEKYGYQMRQYLIHKLNL